MARRSNEKPTGLLAALAAPKRTTTTLLGDIQTHVVKKSAEDSDRRQDIIHPSEMAKSDWCPRRTAFRISGEKPTDPQKENGHHLETIFQEGHDIHSKWQTWLAEMHRLGGLWRCTRCDWSVWGTIPGFCIKCDQPLRYAEVPLDAEAEWKICGHADGAVPDLQAFIEIKSIGLGTLRMEEPSLVSKHTVKTTEGKRVVDYDSIWKDLKRPLLSHRKQAGIYLAIARLRGMNVDKMVFIYENKANQQTKEFVIKYQPDLIDPLIETAKDIKWAVEHGREVPRPDGYTAALQPCSGCEFMRRCYGADGRAEPDPADGAREPGAEAEVGEAADRAAQPAEGRRARTAGRPHRTHRQRTDEPVRPADEVGGVPRGATGPGRGRRTVRRRSTGEDPRPQRD